MSTIEFEIDTIGNTIQIPSSFSNVASKHVKGILIVENEKTKNKPQSRDAEDAFLRKAYQSTITESTAEDEIWKAYLT